MDSNEHVTPIRWRSLSLRLSATFVAVLMTAAFAVGYLFERERAAAVAKREIQHLRLHAERGADEVARFVGQLRGDVLFLASTPPIQGIRRAMEDGGTDAVGGSTQGQWKTRLQQILLAFGEARPEYIQLRLIGAHDEGREIIRVERTEAGLRVTPVEELQQKGERSYFREASRLKPGSVYLSGIDLNREHDQISVPHLPTLRAATPVHDSAGNLFGVVVMDMDMGVPFERARALLHATETLYVANEHGDWLLPQERGRAFAFESGAPYRLAEAFSGQAQRLSRVLSEGGGFLELQGPEGAVIAYVATRAWDPQYADRRLTFILTEPTEQALDRGGWLSPESVLSMVGLLGLGITLSILMVRRLTRSLTALANASGAIAGGNYQISLPEADSSEVGSLLLAFRRMVAEVQRREMALAELNRELEERVEERTAELARQHALQRLILESIADGVVVAGHDGRFLLWNRKAEQIVGAGPDEVQPERWSWHFGIFRNETGEPVPAGELPLVRAIRGESSDNVELYLRNPRRENGRWVQVTARPLLGADGGITGGVAVMIDVTEEKRLRQRVESHHAELAKVGLMALRAEVASSAAHQLSQPIAAMSNYAGAAMRLHNQRRLGDSDLIEFLARIETLARQAGEILDKLRALIRRPNLPLVPVDVNQVADSCLDFFSERIRQQGIRVERHYGRDLPRPVGDPIELEHVLIQLVSNALEAMDGIAPAEHQLSIATLHDPAADLVAIEVADTGRGVSPDLADRLFEPWQTDKPHALGIGLSIAQSAVETRNGRIRMTRRDTGETLFRVELPVSREEKL